MGPYAIAASRTSSPGADSPTPPEDSFGAGGTNPRTGCSTVEQKASVALITDGMNAPLSPDRFVPRGATVVISKLVTSRPARTTAPRPNSARHQAARRSTTRRRRKASDHIQSMFAPRPSIPASRGSKSSTKAGHRARIPNGSRTSSRAVSEMTHASIYPLNLEHVSRCHFRLAT